ncbi:MAG: SRPBCC family protein [Candidatus Obscuribacterales bacterium]
MTIKLISVLYSTPHLFKKSISHFSRQKGRIPVKLIPQAARRALLGRLLCATLLVQPLAVSAPVFAKSVDSGAQKVTEEVINGKTFCVIKESIKAKPEAVWQILTDYNNASRVFPQLKKCHVVADHGTTKVLKHTVAPSGMPGTYEYIIELKEIAPRALEWHRMSGAFKEVDGFWKLEPLEGGHSTLVTYSAYVNGGFFLPQPLVRRQCKVDMPQIMSTLRNEAESIQIANRPTHVQ